MSEHYDFHYQPTGSGAISGQQVLEQTEDAINELGDYVNNNVGGAMDVAQQALETAQNAETNAQTALDTANSFSSAIQSAQQDASTALSTAQTAQTTASNANNTAIQASQDASNAVTTANNASGQVTTLSGTVTALGQRVTTAEGNIGQNTSDITALTTRVGTAEGNITTLQNDVSIAQGNASSAMATAGQVKQQAYVFRYSSTALVASSTNSNSLLDNTDNLKVGDKVIDSSGVLFSITAIDTANSTFTVGSALIDLALDSDVVHTSGAETISGNKTFSNDLSISNTDTTANTPNLSLRNYNADRGSTETSVQTIMFSDKNDKALTLLESRRVSNGNTATNILCYNTDANNNTVSGGVAIIKSQTETYFAPNADNTVTCGRPISRWSKVYGIEYYYGNPSVEFSTKFVTTDTAQTITEIKTFTNTIKSQKEIELTGSRLAYILPGFSASYSGLNLCTYSSNGAVRIGTWKVDDNDNTKHVLNDSLGYLNITIGAINGVNCTYLTPRNSTNSKLGDSTNKWKEINGLTPSSLSLPDIANKIDISSYITNLAGDLNNYTPTVNGWICIQTDNSSVDNYIRCSYGVIMVKSNGNGRASALSCLIPVIANNMVGIRVKCTTLSSAYFIPCQGNV